MASYRGVIGKKLVQADKPCILVRDQGPVTEFATPQELERYVRDSLKEFPFLRFSTSYQHRNGQWYPLPLEF